MTDIQFAKEHMGEYFLYEGNIVRVIGYDITETGVGVIIDYPGEWRWSIGLAEPRDVIYKDLCETGQCQYISWEDLKCL